MVLVTDLVDPFSRAACYAIARLLREQEATVIAVAVSPIRFNPVREKRRAQTRLREFPSAVDHVLSLELDYLVDRLSPQTPVKTVFTLAGEAVRSTVRAALDRLSRCDHEGLRPGLDELDPRKFLRDACARVDRESTGGESDNPQGRGDIDGQDR